MVDVGAVPEPQPVGGATGWLHLLGARVHWADFGGPAAPEAVCVLVHGLGGSTINWEALAPLLTPRMRCLALDLVGFGLTEPNGRGASVADNTALLATFVEAVREPEEPVLLVGSSMGGLIAARYAEGQPDGLAGVVLLDPAVPPTSPVPGPGTLAAVGLYSVPAVGTAFARARRRLRTPEESVMDTLRFCTADPGALDPRVVERHAELARIRLAHPELDRLYSEATRSVFGYLAQRSRADATYDAIAAPVLLVHGTHDRLVPLAGALRAARRRPHWRLRLASRRGHLPMLEVPTWLGTEILDWWEDGRG